MWRDAERACVLLERLSIGGQGEEGKGFVEEGSVSGV